MSPHDFRRIVLAHDLLVRDSCKPPAQAAQTRPDTDAAEPTRERIPAEMAAQGSNG